MNPNQKLSSILMMDNPTQLLSSKLMIEGDLMDIQGKITFPDNPKAEAILQSIKPEMIELSLEDELIFVLRAYAKAVLGRSIRVVEVEKIADRWIGYVKRRVIKRESNSRWKNTLRKRIRKFNDWLDRNEIPITLKKGGKIND